MDNKGNNEIPATVIAAYIGYISMMIAQTNATNPYKELVDLLPIECSDDEKEKWFYEVLAYVAELRLGGLKNENT